MEINKVEISNNKDWFELLHSDYNMFYDYRFISYNNVFNKGINWHHLTFKDKNKTIAILNGCEKNINGKKIYISCDGVSFGGFLWRDKLNVVDYINTVSNFKEYLKRNDFSICKIRNQPFLYQKHFFNEEYEYSLINQGFIISNHSITNIINLKEFEFEKLTNPKKRAIQKSEKNIVIDILEKNINLAFLKPYYDVLYRNRQLKNVIPTHTLEELVYLKNNLPERIIMFSAMVNDIIAGICILFLVKNDVVLNFYLATDENYKKERVADFLLYKSIEWAKKSNLHYYDIGTSNVGKNLLEGLFEFKKKFMANGFLRKTFEFDFI
ncbi:MAG: hypothetical protein WC358_02205 [Ignavibacteria bacterium]